MNDSNDLDLTPIVQELSAALDGKVSEDILRKELEKYIVTYKTGVTIAKDSILKRYSGSKQSGTSVSSSSVTKKIGELEGTEMNVTVIAKMVYVEKKEITTKGITKTIISGIAGDDTGTTSFTIWNDSGEYEKGATYTFKNAYTKKWNDKVQLNIGSRGRVEPNTEVTFDTPVVSSMPQGGSAQDVCIGDITEQTKSVNVVGKISNVETRHVTIKGEDRTIFGGMMADSTGKIQFTAWEDFQLKDGETLCVKNAYIRAWKGIPQLNFGNNATVTRSEEDIGNVSSGPQEKTVEEVMKVGGGLDLAVVGTVVDIRSGSGLIKRCPTCNRSLLNDTCTYCNKDVEPKMDLRLKLTLDDGTGAISAILNCSDTEKITGITLADATEMAKDKMDMGIVANKMASTLLLKKLRVVGNIMTDPEYGPQMSVHSTEVVTTDLIAEAEKLYDSLEANLS